MAKTMTGTLLSNHKLIPVSILVALLVASSGSLSLAQSGEKEGASASAAGSVSSDGGRSGTSLAGGISLGSSTNAQVGSSSPSGDSLSTSSQAQASGGSGALASGNGGLSALGSASAGSTSGSSGGGSQASATASAIISSTPKPEGLVNKLKEIVKHSVGSLTGEEKKSTSVQASGSVSSLGSGSSSSASASGSIGSSGESSSAQAQASLKVNASGQKEGLVDKLADAARKGKEIVKETAKDVKEDVKSLVGQGDNHASGSANGASKAGFSGSLKIGSATANARVQIGSGGNQGEKKGSGLSNLVHKIEGKASELGDKLSSKQSSGPQSSSRSSVSASASASTSPGSERSLAVQMMDKVHAAAKETVLKPIDQALGIKKDPINQIYDQSREIIREPLAIATKPVDAMLVGAFKTSEEAQAERRRMMTAQELKQERMRQERLKKENRSILGEITDSAVELAETPLEIILKPVDRALGFDANGKKNPLIEIIDDVYGFSKKPIDSLARPFEKILKKMGDGDQKYQVSIRFNSESSDPKLFTRLADGALNIADRAITRPIEFLMRPLGYDEVKKKNPLVNGFHSLKNATRLGVELFTKPLDRIIKEIADIGAIKNEAEREAEMERKRQEASRLVKALDTLHKAAQTPWEIVLRPVGKLLGYSKGGRKDPLLRAWDVVHEVVRTPIQVISKPVEDALLGEERRQQRTRSQSNVKVNVRAGQPAKSKQNVFVSGIKKVEEIAVRPFEIMTSPIRRLILGDRNSGSSAQVKAQAGGTVKVQAQAGSSGHQPDKIVRTIEHMNNVVLKPLEVITQPISDVISPEEKKSASINVQGQASSGRRGEGTVSARAQGQTSSGRRGEGTVSVRAQGQASLKQTGGGAASAAAQVHVKG